MAMTAHPNGSVLNTMLTVCVYKCVFVFVSSTRGHPLSETIASSHLGQCVCMCVYTTSPGHFNISDSIICLYFYLYNSYFFFLSLFCSFFHCLTFCWLFFSHLSLFSSNLVSTIIPCCCLLSFGS